MTHPDLPPALRRALGLMVAPPERPEVTDGYLDLLDGDVDTASNTGAVAALWASPLGTVVYDNIQALLRRLMPAWQEPTEWLEIPAGGAVLDVGCGVGNVTASLGRATGSDGVALGLDVSAPMLARAARAETDPQVGFLRADAQRLPFRDGVFDAVISVALLHLIPEPGVAASEMVRVLRPGGRLAVMVPTGGPLGALARRVPKFGARHFGADELGELFETEALSGVRSKTAGAVEWVRGIRM